MPDINPFVFVLGVFVVMLMARAVVIIPENNRGIVNRLGRHLKTLAPGFHVRIPFVDLVTKVDLDASIPGWQGLSQPDLEAALDSVATLGVVVPRKPVGNRSSSPALANANANATVSGGAADLLAAWLVETASEQMGMDLSNDQLAKQRLAERAQSVVGELKSSGSTEINLPFLAADSRGPKHFAMTLTRAQLEQILSA